MSLANRQLTLQSSSLWGIWFSCCLFLNFSLGAGIYGSQIFLCGLVILWIFRKLSLQGGISVLPVLSVVFAFVVWELVVTSGSTNPRFAAELGKIILLTVSSLALIDLFPYEKLSLYTWLIPALVAILTAGVFFLGEWDYSDPVLHRFGVPGFGSPNTTAYVLSFCLILLHRHLSLDQRTTNRYVTFGSYAVLAIALIATQSRGGWLIYLSGLFVMSKKKIRILLAMAAAIGVAVALLTPIGETVSRLNLIMDVRETGGTGRFFLWQQFVQDLVRHPFSLIVGRGPGAISFYIAESDMPIESTHSMMVEIPYSYGLLGVFVFLSVVLRLWYLARNDSSSLPGSSLRTALLIALMVAFVIDSYPLTAQILWFTPLLFLILVAPIQKSFSVFESPVGLCPEKG